MLKQVQHDIIFITNLFTIHNSLLTVHHSQFTKKALAFTLAETLIVMGIIGIVSALTLPNLNSSTGDKEKVAKVKKIYQNLNDAFGRAQAVYGPEDTWFVNDNTGAARVLRFGERLTEFLKVTKNCKMNTGEGCVLYDNNDRYYKFELADGTSVVIDDKGSQSLSNPWNIWLSVDIDANKGKGVGGVDIFNFVTKSESRTIEPSPSILNSIFLPDGGARARWIIDYGNMDYLKADTDGKCKNNTSITLDGVSNTTCK